MLLAGHPRHAPADVASTRLAPTEWAYVAEGGANVVFRYTGPSTSPLHGHVLRIRKAGVRGATPSDIVAFASTHVPLGSAVTYAQVAQAIDVAPAFLDAMNASLAAADRPLHRQASQLNLEMRTVLLLPNVAFDAKGAFSVEIKPKFGKVFDAHDDVHASKRRACRFCMHQQLKLAEGKVDAVSTYCPIMLFARDTMDDALDELLATPQNNLRLFPNDLGMDRDHLRELLSAVLRRVPVLDDLARMHALDRLDIEGLYRLAELDAQLAAETPLPTTTLGELLADTSPPPEVLRTLQKATADRAWTTLTLGEWQELYQRLVDEFMVATTYKDCSLLLALAPCDAAADGMENIVVLPDDSTYQYQVAIVDLDLKTHKSLRFYYELDGQIAQAFDDSTRVECR
ncbi:hypothetical protein SPRG_19601 [Saprolegnia parasitica CBS 223.65]|uniref:Inositol-pentakisphosphate 2-kinase n=1 Tax=Saprolegnia parasitica (strain CBS 223.65) TaxID=695850 RepID=A0A067CPB2_SAPPC|nr:hypothetical protein SPRG_19601 [Saprolegnia parasitica CBS 223.65]KDO31080.1 hypothetical protein SPRG_19601 [Saprolegnia parasitica CBS 223.65]|eukprot:XP_012198333.1 hypothetical protein SPRG_19601 [Saprolegnia parasitica CBS 223.65]